MPKLCKLEMQITFSETVQEAGVAFQVDENFAQGYYLSLEPLRNRMQFKSALRMYDEGGWTFPYDVEFERPVQLAPNIPHKLKIFIQDTLMVAYLDDKVAMNVRMCDYEYRQFGVYHLFYSPGIPEPRKQFVAHAGSEDLDKWTPLPEETFTADGVMYDTAEWRDPFVFWNEEEQSWWMLVASCLKGNRKRQACVGLCVSKDLHHWEIKEPFYSPTATPGACECPDLFKMGD